MDELIRRFDAIADGDLMLCPGRGLAYQRDMSIRVPVDYFAKCHQYDGTEIAARLNKARVAFVAKHAGERRAVDIGIGDGAFIRARPGTCGIDTDPQAAAWLRERELWADDLSRFTVFTMWDVIEHCEQPGLYFRALPEAGWLFCCLPIFDTVTRIRLSKHYRPGEHLYYFTERGFLNWMAEYRFRLVERAEHEIAAGRDAILSFAFCKDLPGYHATVEQYRKLYEPFYGASSRELYLDLIAPLVLARNPSSILDYGCGRSDLAAHFWADGRRRIAWYDPAIPGMQTMPEGEFDLVLCCDVLEHIRLEDVGRVLAEVRAKSRHAIFTISLRPARAKLPDGRNAHVTLLSAGEWGRWIKDVFGPVATVPTPWDHILMLRA